tara:strand:+ start:148 stop:534 length:387 start_codon:yes stop_codon:yes gene_type:complete
MGMYDNLKIKTELLPITDEEKHLLGENPDWQTKDFDCILSTAEITEEGNLKFRRFSYGWDENAVSGMTKITGKKGALTEENVQWVDLKDYHGFVNFYTHDKNNEWWEFDAKFTDGKLVEIVGGKEKEA